jgi:hypothetical protein
MNLERWREMYRALIAEGRVREMPPESITDVVGNLLYGTIFMNYFSGQIESADKQAHDVTNILFNGLLSAQERARRAESAETAKQVHAQDA